MATAALRRATNASRPSWQRFADKGRFSDYLQRIPTYVITAANATFMGASAILAAQLRSLSDNRGSALLGHIQRALRNTVAAERRVADHVLAHPRAALGDPIAEIARAAQVSQPTVIRFCRSLGCEGLNDFKLRLASGLSATVPLTHTQATGDDSTPELGVKVLGNTASAIPQLREQRGAARAGTAGGAKRRSAHQRGWRIGQADLTQPLSGILGIGCSRHRFALADRPDPVHKPHPTHLPRRAQAGGGRTPR